MTGLEIVLIVGVLAVVVGFMVWKSRKDAGK